MTTESEWVDPPLNSGLLEQSRVLLRDEPYEPYTPAEEGLPDPGPCADPAFLADTSDPGIYGDCA